MILQILSWVGYKYIFSLFREKIYLMRPWLIPWNELLKMLLVKKIHSYSQTVIVIPYICSSSPTLLRCSQPTLIPMVFSFSVVTDETLSFIQKSRRLLVVLSPNYVLQGTQALLELKAGLENMASRGNINVILVQYKAVKEMKVKELKRAKTVLTVIKWKGEKSKYPQGRFWKQLQVAMPVKKSPRRCSSEGKGLSYSSLKNIWKGQKNIPVVIT